MQEIRIPEGAPENARASSKVCDVRALWAAAVEEELDRLRRARPHLEARIDRAATVLVVQLSSPPKARPIRCRVAKGGRRVALVESRTTPGTVYEVDPSDWSCGCPDHRRRGVGCLHALAAWVLWKVDRPRKVACAVCGETFHPDWLVQVQEGQAEETLNPGQLVCRVCAPKHGLPVPGQRRVGCDACRDNPGWVHLSEQIVDTESGEVVEAVNTVRCRACMERPPEPTLTDEEMARWMAESDWRWASTYADSHPHWYVRLRDQDPERFHAAARTIWHLGWDRMYLGRPWRSLEIGDHYVWVYTLPKPGMAYPRDTSVINRAPRVHERQPGRQA